MSVVPLKLIRPIEAALLTTENVERAIRQMAECPELRGDSFNLTAHGEISGEYHSTGRFQLADDDAATLISGVLGSGRLASVTVHATRTLENGKDVATAYLSLDFRACTVAVTIPQESGFDADLARELALRIAEPFPYRDSDGGIRDARAERLRAEMVRILEEGRRELAEVRTANAEAQELIKSQRETVQESTIKHHAKVFSDEAAKHAWLALLWVALAGLAVAGLFGVAFTFERIDVVDLAEPQETSGVASEGGEAATPSGFDDLVLTIHILERVTLLSILATVLGVSVRQHRASLHNWVVATHRSNALNSYEAFAGATKEKPGADQLLAQALALTFTPKDTGYSGAPDATHLFTEIVMNFGGGTKS